jgi:hypothetical protein
MPITGNSSYVPTMNEFIAHWGQANTALAPASLTVRLPNNTTRTRVQFMNLRDTLQTQQNDVIGCLSALQIQRGNIRLQKEVLMTKFAMFVSLMDGYYVQTDFYSARPYAPTFTSGQEAFMRPLVDMMLLWGKLDEGPAPAGVTLPLLLGDGTDRTAFEELVAGLQNGYAEERNKAQDLTLARAKRNRTQLEAYETMKSYREAVPGRMTAFPEIIDTLPRLTPLPGHTPVPVNASAVFQAPNLAKVVYDASNDPQLERYELRGTIGEEYDEQDAVVISSHGPNETREFITPFGLNQPGTEIALKVFVILTTGNEAGSATMRVSRPAQVELLEAA